MGRHTDHNLDIEDLLLIVEKLGKNVRPENLDITLKILIEMK